MGHESSLASTHTHRESSVNAGREAVKRSRHTKLEGESVHVRQEEREELEHCSEMQ